MSGVVLHGNPGGKSHHKGKVCGVWVKKCARKTAFKAVWTGPFCGEKCSTVAVRCQKGLTTLSFSRFRATTEKDQINLYKMKDCLLPKFWPLYDFTQVIAVIIPAPVPAPALGCPPPTPTVGLKVPGYACFTARGEVTIVLTTTQFIPIGSVIGHHGFNVTYVSKVKRCCPSKPKRKSSSSSSSKSSSSKSSSKGSCSDCSISSSYTASSSSDSKSKSKSECSESSEHKKHHDKSECSESSDHKKHKKHHHHHDKSESSESSEHRHEKHESSDHKKDHHEKH